MTGQGSSAAALERPSFAEKTAQAPRFDDGQAYDQFMGRWSHELGKAFLPWLQAPPAARWLDVGCGTGIFTCLVAETCAPASVIAVDPSESQLSRARMRAAGSTTEFRPADARELPLPDESFDVVTSALVMNFVPDKARAMSEMRRVAGASVRGHDRSRLSSLPDQA